MHKPFINMSRKRSIEEGHRTFQKNWELQFLYT